MLFLNNLTENPFFFFAWIVVIVFSICVHEASHAYAALRLGDDTAARAGHLSLNPLVQMGPTSLIMLALIGIAWGAVPVNIQRFRQPWAGAAVAFAGPAANLLLCAVFALLSVLWERLGGPRGQEVDMFLRLGGVANGVLFVLNMLPVPMLDGWSVFAYFFPAMGRVSPGQSQTISLVLIAAVFLTPAGALIWGLGGALAGSWTRLFGLVLGV